MPSSEIEFVRECGRVWLRKREPGTARGHALVNRIRGRAATHMSTEDIMRLTRGDDA